MKITQPRLENVLHEDTEIQTALEKNDEDLTGYSFKSQRIEGVKKSNLSVQSCIFSNCSFGACSIRKSQFSDVVFKNCDLSNVNLTECGFHRVEFTGCKLMGTNMSDGTFNHITFDECRGEYMNLSMSKMRYIQFTRSNLQGAGIEGCQLMNVSFDACNLMEAEFYRTSLKASICRTRKYPVSVSQTLPITSCEDLPFPPYKLWNWHECWV